MATAGTTTVADDSVTTLFNSESDGGPAAVYKVNPTDGDIVVGVEGMPGHTDPATTPTFPIASGQSEYLSLESLMGGIAKGSIRRVYAKAVTGSVAVAHGAVAARKD